MKKSFIVAGIRWTVYPLDSKRFGRRRRYVTVNGVRWYIYPVDSYRLEV